MEQDIRFCKTSDGVRIAYATAGEGPALLWVPGWLSHLELDLEFPPFRERVESLARDFTLIRFDKRGTGLSQRGLSDHSQDAHVLDIEAVVSALDLGRFALAGYSEGGPICIAYTARHPNVVTHLILIGTWATAERSAGGREMQRALTSIVKNEWGIGSRLLADLFFGEDAGPNVLQMFASYQRQAATVDDAVRSAESLFQFDVTHLLPNISTPTLVLHARSDRAAPIAGGQEIAAGIRGAHFVSFDGHHVPNRKQMAQVDDAIREFVLGAAPRRPQTAASSPSALVTIMFTDIEGSTGLTQRLGDERAQEVLREHNTIIREALKAHGGSEIKHTGDGVMPSFVVASAALECAIAIQKAFQEQNEDVGARHTGHGEAPRTSNQGVSTETGPAPVGASPLRPESTATPETPIRVRIGVNTGEPVAEEGDLFGAAVQLAARVCAQAGAGEILVPEGVRHLVAGKGFLFSDRGDVALRGFEDPVRLYEVRWAD